MNWPMDIPDLPFKKPEAFDRLEELGPDVLRSMPKVEIDEMIQLAADETARNYLKSGKQDWEECKSLIIMALRTTGGAIGGEFGALLVAESEKAAEEAVKTLSESSTD